MYRYSFGLVSGLEFDGMYLETGECRDTALIVWSFPPQDQRYPVEAFGERPDVCGSRLERKSGFCRAGQGELRVLPDPVPEARPLDQHQDRAVSCLCLPSASSSHPYLT